MADMIGINRRVDKKSYEQLKKGIIPDNAFKFNVPIRALQFLSEVPHTENGQVTEEYSHMYDKSRYAYLLDAPFKISNLCCNQMKKNPMKHYQKKTGRNPFVGTMAEESRLRKTQWIKFGCNMFDAKYPASKPLSFWTEQDILQYIKKYNLKIADAYGEVYYTDDAGFKYENPFVTEGLTLTTSKAKRTGCVFCMFGITQDLKRFELLNQEEPKLCDYVMCGGEFNGEYWQPSENGLGYWFVIEWLNKFGGLKISIPNREYYLNTYSTDRTKEILSGGVV